MSQGTIKQPTTGVFSATAENNNLNAALDALDTDNAGGSAPTNSVGGVAGVGKNWLDTSATPPVLRQYTGNGGGSGYQAIGAHWLDGGPIVSQPVGGASRNLIAANVTNPFFAAPATPTAMMKITADYLVVEDVNGLCKVLKNVNVTPSLLVSGVGGLVGTSLAANTWYYPYAVYNPATNDVKGIWSASASSPALPTGYTMWGRGGPGFQTDSGSHLYNVVAYDRDAQYSQPLVLASGAQGVITDPTWASFSLANFIPPTAFRVRGFLYSLGSTGSAIAAPSATYQNLNFNMPALCNVGQPTTSPFDWMVEAYSLKYASASGQSRLQILGYRDSF